MKVFVNAIEGGGAVNEKEKVDAYARQWGALDAHFAAVEQRGLDAALRAERAHTSKSEAKRKLLAENHPAEPSTYLSKLRTLELVEGRGELRASEELVR